MCLRYCRQVPAPKKKVWKLIAKNRQGEFVSFVTFFIWKSDTIFTSGMMLDEDSNVAGSEFIHTFTEEKPTMECINNIIQTWKGGWSLSHNYVSGYKLGLVRCTLDGLCYKGVDENYNLGYAATECTLHPETWEEIYSYTKLPFDKLWKG